MGAHRAAPPSPAARARTARRPSRSAATGASTSRSSPSPYCGDSLTPYLVVTSRATASARWAPLVRVAPPTWKYGFDDAPRIAVDERSGRVYVAWTRSLSKRRRRSSSARAATAARRGAPPVPVSAHAAAPASATLAVAANGDLYIAGIDAKLGLWIARSTDGAKTFAAPQAAATLRRESRGGLRAHGAGPAAEGADGVRRARPDDRRRRGPRRTSCTATSARTRPRTSMRSTLDREPEAASRARRSTRRDEEDAAVPAGGGARPDDRRRSGRAGTTRPSTTNAHRAWFTCSASHNGRTWTRAAARVGRADLAEHPLRHARRRGPLPGRRRAAGRRARLLGRRPGDRELVRHLHGRDPREGRVLPEN